MDGEPPVRCACPKPSGEAPSSSGALGGLLLRAGRLNEAIIRINEGIAAAKDVQIPTDWTYLALAHARKGKLAEARQILERFRDWRPDSVRQTSGICRSLPSSGARPSCAWSGKEKAKK